MAQGAVLSNQDNIVFNKGYLYGTLDGGAADGVEFGVLQRVSFNMAIELAELSGPESLSPVGVGVRSKNLTGSYESGVVHPEQFTMALGGTMAYDVGTDTTTYTELVDDEPGPFDIHFKSHPTVPDVELRFYNCVASQWRIFEGANREWNVASGSFRVYGQNTADGSRLYTLTKPGHLNTSS